VKKSEANVPFRLALTASLGLFGCYAGMGLRTPLPGQDEFVSDGLKVERHEFATEDGVTLRVKRYANPEGIPVLMCHGFGGCGSSFDLPREGRNMPVYLARQGFDVWISSFRGCGHGPYASDCGDWTHSIDDLAIYDAPALVDGVAAATGKRLFWIGHSMGGEVLYMYLQGVRCEDGGVVSDETLLRERHEKLAGGIAMGSPPAFWYPAGHPYHLVFASRPARAVLWQLLSEMLRKECVSPRIFRPGGAKRFLDGRPRLQMAISRTPFMIPTYCRKNTDKDATTSLVRWGTGDVSAGMWVQLLQGLLEDEFLEHPGRAEPGRQYSYTAGMGLISLPMFFVTGDKDFANPGAIRRFGYDAVSSDVKDYLNLAGYGHTDMLMGRNAETEVYPLLAGWMEKVIQG
jgi:pimeloyl-ACP methyl ester carboxylesterase